MSLVTLKPGLTVAEAAAVAGVDTKTIVRWIEADQLDALKVHAKMFFVPQDALERCMERRAAKKAAVKA
jgi:excisionase family DNA binding protein